MKTVLICNQKGGVGKTLIADELAFALERDGIPYNFFDLDGQGSSIHETSETDDAQVQIIDTPGALNKNLTKWVEAADFVIVPTMLSSRDVGPLERMIKILEPYKGKPILYVLNGFNRFNAAKEFRDWFMTKYPDLKTAILTDTTAFDQAGARRMSIVLFQPRGTGSKNIEYIYNTVKYELNLREAL